MNQLKSCVICVLLTICFMNSIAQQVPSFREPDYNKPKLFADLPEKITLNVSSLSDLLSASEGQSVNVHLGGNFNYRGVVVSKSDPSDAYVKSIVIKATNRQGATLTFTQVRNSEDGINYIGRILSYAHSDAFDIKSENGQYKLVKKNLYDLFNE